MEIEILHDQALRYWCQRLDLPAGAVETLAALARTVTEDEALRQAFQCFYQKTTLDGDWHREWSPLPFDPQVEARLGEQTSLFYLLAYMAALPQAQSTYLRRGIGMDIFDATMQDFRIWLCHHYDLHGKWRFDEFPWMWRHLTCQLFRLGRLQFMLKPFESGVTAYRHATSGQVLLLADPEELLRADGAAYGAGIPDSERAAQDETGTPTGESWRPVFEASDAGWRGHPVSPFGRVQKTPVLLHKADWQPILSAGDTVLDIHIPRKDTFTLETCTESLEMAYAFFAEHEPERPFRASFCHTWFFTPQLQRLLPPHSNILRFQREFYLYPFAGGPEFLWGYVFGENHKDPATAPRNTSLQAAVLDWIAGGGELFDLPGVAFHGPDAWGSQPYMRAWERAHPHE